MRLWHLVFFVHEGDGVVRESDEASQNVPTTQPVNVDVVRNARVLMLHFHQVHNYRPSITEHVPCYEVGDREHDPHHTLGLHHLGTKRFLVMYALVLLQFQPLWT